MIQWSDWQYTPLTAPLLLIGLICAWVAHVAWRRRAVPGATPFAVLLTGIAGWTLLSLVEKSIVAHEPHRAVSTLMYVFIVMTPGAWFVFAVRFSRRDGWLTPRVVRLLFIHPILVVLLAFTDHWHGWFRAATAMRPSTLSAVMEVEYGPLFWLHTAYTYLLFAAGAVFLIAGATERTRVTHWQRAALLLGMLVPTLGNVSYVFRWLPLDYGDLTPVYFAITALLAAWVLFPVRFFDVLPLAREFVLDCLTDPVFVLDHQLRLLDANRAARALLHGAQPRQRLPALMDVFPELAHLLPVELPADSSTNEIQLPSVSAERFWDMHVLPMKDHGVRVGTLVRLTDVTERKRAERERRDLDERLRQMQKLQSLAVLAGGVAHDFNNLLTVILGNTELTLRSLGRTSFSSSLLRNVVEAANQAAGLTRQMLTFAGKSRFLPQRLSLSALVAGMHDLLQAAVGRPATLEMDLSPDLPPLLGDAGQLQQLVLNLVTNASEALGEQSGTICLCTRRVEVRAEDLAAAAANEGLTPGVHLLLEVSDTGSGIDLATRGRIFEPFFTTKFTGRGLGLSVVLGVVRAHQGALFVTSDPGLGSQFRVLFPIAGPSALPTEAEAPSVEAGLAQVGGTILLVDDEEHVRNVAEQFLKQAGFEVLAVPDGVEALKRYRDHAASIDLVLLDMTMPVLSGGEVFQQLRGFDPDLPIVLMSGYDEQTVLGKLGGQFPSAFLRKPYRGEELVMRIRDVLATAQELLR